MSQFSSKTRNISGNARGPFEFLRLAFKNSKLDVVAIQEFGWNKMEAARSSETLVSNHHTTRYNNQENQNLKSRNIRMNFKEMGLEGVEWVHLAQDRNQWQALVNTVMNLRVP
jgi:hypothetical protein